MRKFFVRFAGDNDFAQTVEGFVKSLAPRIFYGCWDDITKALVVDLFNQHAFSFYALHQCNDFAPEERLRDYLKIEEKDVYFDDEVDGFINNNHDGCLAYITHNGDIEYHIM